METFKLFIFLKKYLYCNGMGYIWEIIFNINKYFKKIKK